jgi:DNA-directed RNA polymerase subunit M/transcription elongation factor TFIIS
MEGSTGNRIARPARQSTGRRLLRGGWCYVCGAYLLLAKGYRDQCHPCRDMAEDAEEVTHDSRIRCPKCKHVESVSDGDNYDLYGDGEHEVSCGACGYEYEVSTSVSYSFQSPALIESDKAEE